MYFLDAIDFGGSLAKGFWDLIFWPRIFVKSKLIIQPRVPIWKEQEARRLWLGKGMKE